MMFELLSDVMRDRFLNTWISSVLTSETWSLQYFNHRIEVRTPARIRPYPTGRLLGVAMSQALRARLRSHCPSGGCRTSAKNGLFSCFWTIKTACPPFKNACTGILERRLFQNDQSPTDPSGTKATRPSGPRCPFEEKCCELALTPSRLSTQRFLKRPALSFDA